MITTITHEDNEYEIRVDRSVRAVATSNALKGLSYASPALDFVEAFVLSINGDSPSDFDETIQMKAGVKAANFLDEKLHG